MDRGTMLRTHQYLAPHESVAYAYISSIKEEGRMGDGVFVRERGAGAALWSTQPHYSVDRTAHPLHCSSNQPKLTGLIWSPQNRTGLLYGLKGAADEISRMINQECRYCLFFFFSAPHCQVQWYDTSSEHHLSLAIQNDTRMTQTCGRDVSLRCFEQCDLPRGRAAWRWRVIVRDTLGVMSRGPGRRDESFPEM